MKGIKNTCSIKQLYLLVAFICLSGIVNAQSQENLIADSTQVEPSFNFSGFPIVFILPETGFAFGGVGLAVFNLGKEKAWRKSQAQLGIAYTLKNQFLLFIPYELYYKEHWKLQGELGYYRYFYNYYGVGINSFEDNLENYDANFPRLISNLSYRFNESFFVGVQYRFDYFVIPNVGELLQQDQLPGIDGGAVSNFGFTASYDTRDDIFYPSKGLFVNFTSEFSTPILGSSYQYSQLQLDITKYKEIWKNHILVANLYTGNTIGDAPFFNYLYLASGKRSRGIADRRFIDKTMALTQIEYRYPIYKRFSGVAFTSLGTVSNTFAGLIDESYKIAYGLGLRFQLSKHQKSNIRLDLANSAEGFQFYLTIGEAF